MKLQLLGRPDSRLLGFLTNCLPLISEPIIDLHTRLSRNINYKLNLSACAAGGLEVKLTVTNRAMTRPRLLTLARTLGKTRVLQSAPQPSSIGLPPEKVIF